VTVESVEQLAEALYHRDRRALSRLITLAESRAAGEPERADEVLRYLRANRAPPDAVRVAFTGAPGVGKSTLVEAYGMELSSAGRRIAVLALDPSSPHSGGSLLGDQTRMPRLSQTEGAFIRPSPAKDALGGIGDATLQSALLCEWAGYDPVVIETVGVGQSELDVRDVADCVVLVLAPDLGDEIQGLKRGITEICDLVVVNKRDLSEERARHTQQLYESALATRSHTVKVLLSSAVQGTGIAELVEAVEASRERVRRTGQVEQRRREQLRGQLRRAVAQKLRRALDAAPERAHIEQQLERGELTLEQAVRALWRAVS
jgi:LAO/AO transport system kinase